MNHFISVFASLMILSMLTVATPCHAVTPGKTFYVSKLGDNSDGSSWAKAFTSVQTALQAIPDEQGGYHIIIRPDTYVEANIFPSHRGAEGAYNTLEGDYDGSLGSGTTGWVILDSGDPEKGFKSYDWWGNIRSYSKGWSKEHTEETFSAIGWDRWALKRLYATGGDGGIFFDCTDHVEPFSVLVEDCISIGRAFGGGVGNCLSRTGEPITYRRCLLWALDWWGDTAGAYVRVENETMPNRPDALFDSCTMVSPQCSLKGGNFGFKTYMWVHVKDCTLVTLNFSQPAGTPTDGIIQSVEQGKLLKVTLEDSRLMGYKVFGVRVNKDTVKDLQYEIKGNVQAYVQFTQEVPKGINQVNLWPTDWFNAIIPPTMHPSPAPKLTKLPTFYGQSTMESTPVMYQGKPMLLTSEREASSTPDLNKMSLFILDLNTGAEISRFAKTHSFGSAFVEGDQFNVWGSEYTKDDWTHDIYQFTSTDLKTWKRTLAIPREGDEHLFNTSVCKDPQGYLMAYESNKPVPFCFKFARSKDLVTREKIPGMTFTGTGNEYSACPVIRYVAPYYYVIYLHAAIAGHNGWVSFMARSKDLEQWELSPNNPILEAGEGEGCNNSDVDLFEWQGNTYLFYATGDQATWGKVASALWPGSMKNFFETQFPAGIPCVTVSTRPMEK